VVADAAGERYVRRMDVEHGGRATLRLSATDDTQVEYDVEFLTKDGRFAAHATVALSDGAVEVRSDDAVPAWLVELARTTLRGAFRTARATSSWPRRLSRWRGGPNEEDES